MRRLLLVILLFIGVVACDDAYKSSIPNVSFHFSCDLVQSEYSKLTIPGQFIKKEKNINGIPVGYAGLIIGQSAISPGDYVAFDAACPVEASRSVSVEIQDDGLGTAVCPTCGTKYHLSNSGAPVEGEGKEYLKRYKVIVSGAINITLQVNN